MPPRWLTRERERATPAWLPAHFEACRRELAETRAFIERMQRGVA